MSSQYPGKFIPVEWQPAYWPNSNYAGYITNDNEQKFWVTEGQALPLCELLNGLIDIADFYADTTTDVPPWVHGDAYRRLINLKQVMEP